MKKLIIISLMVGLVSAASADAELIANGSFEDGLASIGNYVIIASGGAGIDNWTVGGGGVDYIGTFWQTADGARSLDMNAGNPGSVAQSFATTNGGKYAVSFYLAGNPGAPTVKDLRVSAAGQSEDFDFDITDKTTLNMGWVQKDWSFTANAATTELKFESLTTGGNRDAGPALDNVSVTLVPEPSSCLLGAMGLGIVGWLKRRNVKGEGIG